MPEINSPLRIVCELRNIVLLRPPQQQLNVAVSIQNNTSSMQNVLVTSILNPTATERSPAIYGIDYYEHQQSSRMLGRLSGSCNFWLLTLNKGTSIMIDMLPIEHWGDEDTDKIELEILSCSKILVDHSELTHALGKQQAMENTQQYHFADFKMTSSLNTQDFEEIPLTFIDENRFSFHFTTTPR